MIDKQLLDLLTTFEKKTGEICYIKFFNDESGHIGFEKDRTCIIDFNDFKELELIIKVVKVLNNASSHH